MVSRLFESDISPIFPPSPSFFDSTDEDIHFFHQHYLHHHHHPHLLLANFSQDQQLPLLTTDTSSESIELQTPQINRETIMNKYNYDCGGGGNGGGGENESAIMGNKKSTSLCGKNPRRRSIKKDRHTKIVTAQGPRDRRMRLSLDIARRFFMVQDMLGFDKASKTVEWLLTKSKEAIKELSRSVSQSKLSCTGSVKSVSSASECDVVSGIDYMTTDEYVHQVNISSGKSLGGLVKERRTKQTRKATFNPIAKESRAKARARARERTIEKQMRSRSQHCPEVRLHKLQKIRSSISFEIGEESGSQSHDESLKSSMDVATETEPSSHSVDCQGSIQDMVDESLAVTNKASSPSIFDYHHDMEMSQVLAPNNNDFPNFSGNTWDVDSPGTGSSYSSIMNMNLSPVNLHDQITVAFPHTTSGTTSHSHYADIQLSWESYNNPSLFHC